ncbi:MAG: hypothetical protein M1812_000194 [Candelaria pacifica]|nr:MAG: hypothetical protein M1812_000194 [Candelaria pacifica]
MPRGSPYRGCYDQRSCTRNTDCSKISYDDYQPDLADSFAEELRCGQQTHFECSQSRPDLCYRHPFGQRNHSRHYPKIHKNSLRDERRRLRFERKILEAGQAKLRRDQKWLRWKTQRLQMRQPHAQFYETTLSPGSSSLSPDDSTSNLLRSDTSFPGYRVPGYGDPDDNSTCVSPSSPPVLVAQSKDELDRYNQSWQAVPAESSALPWPTADLTSAKLSARDHTTRDRMVWSEPKVMTWNAFKFLIQGFGIKPHLEMSESGPTWNIANASREQLIALKKQMRLDMLRWSPDKTLHRHPSLRTDERAKAVYEAVQDIYKECQSRLLGVY